MPQQLIMVEFDNAYTEKCVACGHTVEQDETERCKGCNNIYDWGCVEFDVDGNVNCKICNFYDDYE